MRYLLIFIVASTLAACGSDKNVRERTAPAETNAPVRSASPPLHEVYQGEDFVEQNIEGWQIRCKKDSRDNSKYCQGAKDDFNLGILLSAAGQASYRITIGAGSQYPGSEQLLRIDADTPLNAGTKGFEDAASRQIIERMKSARQVMTRYRKWPGGYVDKVSNIGRFDQVLNYMYSTLQSL